MSTSTTDLKQQALAYHELPRPGKIGTLITKPAATQADLCLAYTPGVAQPVLEIAKDEKNAYRYTNKGNLVAVITDGTAILGLGNHGPLASKPVMEGKALLFKLCADIDVFDIEVNTPSVAAFIETAKAISPTFGGINLEDIKAPECFEIEDALKAALNIPVFHDDQHGTAIVVAAGLLNALELQGKTLEKAKIVCLGAGAAGLATMKLLLQLGALRKNIYVLDRDGVIYPERSNLNKYKEAFANNTSDRTLTDALKNADIFIGVSGANLVQEEQLKGMAPKPIVFALSNPDPEIHPENIRRARPDAIIATGRSDYSNQINNVLCFPYIFRAALDVRARSINSEMFVAAVKAIASIAKMEVPESVQNMYAKEPNLRFGPNYIIPKPFDSRLVSVLVPAIKEAAKSSGVAGI
jgi:malate dehydrogenase (oxaloacetate-decarboxylating)(NADP+)